jgi:hypothetical protein
MANIQSFTPETVDRIRRTVRDVLGEDKRRRPERRRKNAIFRQPKIVTGKLDEDHLSGDTATYSLYSDDGLTDSGVNVEVEDTPVFIDAGKKLAANTWARLYRGDDGNYYLLSPSSCPVDQ